MEFSLKQLGGIVLAIIAIILTAALVSGVVDKTSDKIDAEMDNIGSISEQYTNPSGGH